MIGFLLALIFAAGVGLVWFGAVVGVSSPRLGRSSRLGALLDNAALDIAPYAFVAVIAGLRAVAGAGGVVDRGQSRRSDRRTAGWRVRAGRVGALAARAPGARARARVARGAIATRRRA